MATQQKDVKSWIVMYPAYIDESLTLEEGRKVSKALALQNPTVIELKQACDRLKLTAVMEKKFYPRQQWVMGRLKIQMKDDSGKLLSQYKNRMDIYRAIATNIKAARPAPKAQTQQTKKKGKK